MNLAASGSVFGPFAYWDIASAYDKYSALLDVIIYSALFVALVHAALRKRFPGRSGRAIAVVSGVALGISLAITEVQFGWSLKRLAPIAILFALAIFGIVIFGIIRHLSLSTTLATTLGFVIVYIAVAALTPETMQTITARFPFVHLVAMFLLLLSLFQLTMRAVPTRKRGPPAKRWLMPRIPGAAPNATVRAKTKKQSVNEVASKEATQEKKSLRTFKFLRQKTLPEAVARTAKVEHTLESVLSAVGSPKPDWNGIARASAAISHEADSIIDTIDRIRLLDRRLRSFDLSSFRELRSHYHELDAKGQKRLRELILYEHKKLTEEHNVERLCAECEQRHQGFRQAMNELVKAALNANREQTKIVAGKALKLEDQQQHGFKHIRHIEKRLVRITRKRLRI